MSKCILVAENDKLNMRLFHDVLTHRGYETVELDDGLAALAAARKHPPDLILTDIQLPGMSGIELTGRVKADPALARVPVIAVTGFVGKADEARIRASGVDDFVTKPVAPSRLIAAVERNLTKNTNGNGNGNGHAVADEAPPWKIVEDFARHATAPRTPPGPEPKPASASIPEPPAGDPSQLLGTALAFTGAFLALAMSPAAAGLEGLKGLYVAHFPDAASGLAPGRPVVWQGEAVGRAVRVDLDRALPGGIRAVLQIDQVPDGLEEMTAVLRHDATSGDPYVELRPSTVASVRLYAHVNRAATSLRALDAEMARDVENLPRWFHQAAAAMDGAAQHIDWRDTRALARALKRIAALMDTVGRHAGDITPERREDWIGDVSQLLAESRDLIGLLRQIAGRMEREATQNRSP